MKKKSKWQVREEWTALVEGRKPERSQGEATFLQQCRDNDLEPQREVYLIDGRDWRVDFYFIHRDIAVELEGGTAYGKSRHARGSGFDEDARKYNAISLAGVKLLRFSTEMVLTGEAIETVKAALSR